MALAQNLLPLLEKCRALAGKYGLREHAVYLLEGTWSGAVTGGGSETLVVAQLQESSQNPKVRWLRDEQLVLGDHADGTVKIGPITSEHSTGGLDLDDVFGTALTTGETLHVRIVGPKHPSPGKRYEITRIEADRAMHRMLWAKPA